MSITQIQVELFRGLLDQLSTNRKYNNAEALEMHLHLFEQPLVLSSRAGSDQAGIAAYLREIIVSQGITNIEQLLHYNDKKSRQMAAFLDTLTLPSNEDNKCEPLSIAKQLLVETGEIDKLRSSPQKPRVGTNRLSAMHVGSTSGMHIKAEQDWERDIYSTIKDALSAQLSEEKRGKTTYASYKISVDNAIGRSYLEKFIGRIRDSVAVMCNKEVKYLRVDQAGLESARSIQTLRNWMMHYYADRHVPDYDNIISVIGQERAIEDNAFKATLFEWLVYSKLFISDSCYQQLAAFDQGPYEAWFILQNAHLTYYSGHGFSAWLKASYERLFSKKRWSILTTTAGQSWLTSDDPGFTINLQDMHAGLDASAVIRSTTSIRSDTMVFYPLSTKYCLKIEPLVAVEDEGYNLEQIQFEPTSKKDVDFVNEMTMMTHQEIVIGRSQKMLKQYKHTYMAKNGKSGDGHRNGQVTDRSQTHNPKTDKWVKRDTETGRFMDQKADDKPFKGVRKEK